MELYLTVDLGSSLIKVLYSNDATKQPSYIAIEPEIIEVPVVKYLDEYRRTNFTGHPEDYAFIEFESKYYAVGMLAKKKFRSTTNLALLKFDYAIPRILASVWVAIEKLGGAKKTKLFLTCLLPPGELKDKHLLDRYLTIALNSFDSPSGTLQVKLMYLNCYSEGSGLSMLYQQRHPECRDRSLGVVMMGHRNLSAYTVNRGVPDTYKSSDLGFVSMVREIQEKTSGYSEYNITHSVARYLLGEITDSGLNPKYLNELLLKTRDADRQEELAQLVQAIESAKKIYWESISQWLDLQLAEITDVLIGGGTCRMFVKEFRRYTCNLPRIVGRPDRSLFNAGLSYPEVTLVPPELRDRYADAVCLWELGLMPVVRDYQGRKLISKK